MKNHFFGIYYKHQAKDGYTLAVIISRANEGPMVQVITKYGSFYIKDTSSIKADRNGMTFHVNQEGLVMEGTITYSDMIKAKKDIMSYYRFLPIECKHRIYSLYHRLSGSLTINGEVIDFTDGNGYMEGDKGRNFPSKYLWLNSVSPAFTIMLAVASIPLGLFTIQGITCEVCLDKKEYLFGTYNFAKMKVISKDHLLLKKGPYTLEIFIDDHEGHPLKAPVKGNMVRFIHECPSVRIHYLFKKKNIVLKDGYHDYASFEYVFE